MKKSPKSESASTYLTKATHEVLSQLRDAEFFSVIDAKRGYWHILLDEARSYLTTRCIPETLRFNATGPERSHRHCWCYIRIRSDRGRARCKHRKSHDQIQGEGNQQRQTRWPHLKTAKASYLTCARYSGWLASLTAPLRELPKMDVACVGTWTRSLIRPGKQ